MSSDADTREMFLEGQRTWPTVKLAFEAFAAHCAPLLEGGGGPLREAAALYLCCACAHADPAALRAFEGEGLAVAKASIARILRDPDFVQDTLQEVWDKLLLGAGAKVKQYAGRGPLKAWIGIAATRVALDRVRVRGRVAARQVELSEQLAEREVSPEAWLTKARYGAAFERAVKGAIAALSVQERNVLRMHLAGHCSIDEIGRAYNVHRATAARWLDRIRAGIYESVRRDLCVRQDKLTASELKSLAILMEDQLELSLSGVSTGLSASGVDA